MSKYEKQKSQFNIPYNPSIDNLDSILLLGYKELTSTEKLIYLTITHLFRDGDRLSNNALINIFPKCERSIYYALAKLHAEGLIQYKRNRIFPCAPDYKDETFEKAMAYLTKHTGAYSQTKSHLEV